MVNISKVLKEKTNSIVENWKAKNRADKKIESSNKLPDKDIEDSMHSLIEAMAAALSSSEESDFEESAKESLKHGEHRALQGFDPSEVAREYLLLRQEIFSQLEPDLLELSLKRSNRTFRQIDAIIDEAIAQCFDKYVEERFQKQRDIEHQLQLNIQELERLLRLNRDNLSHLAHEIKTPLTSIMGYSQTILRKEQLAIPDERLYPTSDLIDRVLRSSRILLELVNDALELSRCDGQQRFNLARVSVVSMLDSSLEVIEPLVTNKGLRLEKDYDRAPTEVITDRARFEQVAINFLSNAVRYTMEGFIRVSCEALPDEKWSITITDSGIGVAPEEQARLFEPFYRASNTQSIKEGTGLGLTIAAKLVSMLRGEIKIESEVGKGTSFTLIFPNELVIESGIGS